ncbi:hypothetical protein [uncultured Lamprocystis sp.]|uniref:hypothetical protein n=1 Tax=uncultured Lamprocystis sp. TaxID=543132 RepID=UPI0025DA5E1C|nr:hypothetical protein [uncultured Lamprocystis sp.]
MDKRSASTIGLAADTLLAAATQIWNCWATRRICDPTPISCRATERVRRELLRFV